MRKAFIAGGIAAALVAATGAGAGTYLALDKNVTISVDGDVREVHTFAGTVGDVLAAEGVKFGDRDVVAPTPSADLSEGARIAVRYARPLRLTVDGEPTTHWTTGTDVDTALDQLGLRFHGAELSASRSAGIERDGLALEVATNKQVTILHDGGRTTLQTTGMQVDEALADAEIKLGDEDIVKPRVGSPLTSGDKIRVTRVVTKKEEVEVDLPYDTIREADPEVYEDEADETDQEGSTGVKVVTRRVKYVDGEKKSSKVIDAKIAAEPVDEIVRYGTKERPVEEEEDTSDSDDGDSGGDSDSDDGGGSSTGTDADSLNWAALADCESGGNPSAVNPAGYYGLYQFSLSTWASVGGSGNPADASSDEQTYRAKLLYDKAGAGQWPYCGQFLFS